MKKIEFINDSAPYLSAENLNLLQDNVENAISEVEDAISEIDKNIYSYEEQRVGTWIDGKPLYRRVFSGTFRGVTSHSVNDILPTSYEVKRTDGITIQDNGVIRPLQFYFLYQNNPYYTSYMLEKNTTNNTYKLAFYYSADYSGFTFVVTVEYTKTTD